MDIPASIVREFPPSAEALLDRLRRTIDDSMLTDIARADYGFQANEMFAVLRKIRDEGTFPASLSGQLCEVLALSCHHDPDQPRSPSFEPGPTGRRGHEVRLFAATLVLQVGVSSSLVHVESALARAIVDTRIVGGETSELLAQLLTWLVTQPSDSPRLLLCVAILVLAVRCRAGRFTEGEVGAVADWVIGAEAGEMRVAGEPMFDFSVGQGCWDATATELRDAAKALAAAEVREKIEMCAILLDNGWNVRG